jgi:hypothetical protein
MLVALIATAWCYANQMWHADDWKVPSAYLGPFRGPSKSDVLLHLAFIRAARDGHFVPLQSKVVPELGAPGVANWNDWPITEELPIFSMGMLARAVGIFAALNIALLSCHLFAGLSFYCVARYYNTDIAWSLAGAIAFGLASFIFSQSPDHIFVALCWHVPLFIVIWDWFANDKIPMPGSGRFWFGIAVGIVAGLQMPYYAAVFGQLVLLGALVSFTRTRKHYQLVSGFSFLAAAALAFALMNLDTWLYQIRFGGNPNAVVRPYQWLEVYGLKMVDFVTPPLSHHWAMFRNFADWRIHTQILHDEGSYLGIIGVTALLLLCGVAINALIRRKARDVPSGFWQALWIFVFFTTGGLNAVAGLMGFTLLRAGCRFSIVILAIALLFACRWMSRRGVRPRSAMFVTAIVALVTIMDQVPTKLSEAEKDTIARQILSDRKFVAEMEAALPAGAKVFQLPVMDFPEAPLQNLSSYDHLRPYLFSHRLHFSFGNVKGRHDDGWQKGLVARPWPEAIDQLKQRGFDALYINQAAYPGQVPPVREVLKGVGYDKIIDSDTGDLICVILN